MWYVIRYLFTKPLRNVFGSHILSKRWVVERVQYKKRARRIVFFFFLLTEGLPTKNDVRKKTRTINTLGYYETVWTKIIKNDKIDTAKKSLKVFQVF